MLPPPVNSALSRLFEGVSRRDLAETSAGLSESYRTGAAPPGGHITSRDEALAYLAVRLPATYGAALGALRQIANANPGFAPTTILDLGAGPGSAALAVGVVWPTVTSMTLVEPNHHLAGFGREILDHMGGVFADAEWLGADIEALRSHQPADLVIASYVLSELREVERVRALETMGHLSRDLVVVVEPGSRAGFAVVRAARAVQIESGRVVVAPCPHQFECPMAGEDWCHFSARVPRSRLHLQVKRGSVPYEDEPYSYVATSRDAGPVGSSRVLAPPRRSGSSIMLKLCTTEGTVDQRLVSRGDRGAFAAAKQVVWGSSL